MHTCTDPHMHTTQMCHTSAYVYVCLSNPISTPTPLPTHYVAHHLHTPPQPNSCTNPPPTQMLLLILSVLWYILLSPCSSSSSPTSSSLTFTSTCMEMSDCPYLKAGEHWPLRGWMAREM